MAPPDRLYSIMSTRFQHIQADGDKSDMSSALEMAIDSHRCVTLRFQSDFLPYNFNLVLYFCPRLKLKTVSTLDYIRFLLVCIDVLCSCQFSLERGVGPEEQRAS